MAHLIDKDALVAEIEKLKAGALQKKSQCKRSGLEKIMHQIGAYNKVLSFLNTFEVKEVDLEKEFNNFLDNVEGMPRMFHSIEQIEWGKDIAKHFFELGLKAKKEE